MLDLDENLCTYCRLIILGHIKIWDYLCV